MLQIKEGLLGILPGQAGALRCCAELIESILWP